MALIECGECGQIVSDKAEACPHCGCPVEKPMVCPECGQSIAVGNVFCQNCGYPLDSKNNTSTESNHELTGKNFECGLDSDGIPNHRKRNVVLALATLLLLGGLLCSLYNAGVFNSASLTVDKVTMSEQVVPVEVKEFWENTNFEQNGNDVEHELSSRAKNGDIGAIRDLGMCFLHPESANGSHLQRDSSLGIKLLEKAANQNDAEAQYMLSGEYFGMFDSDDNINYEKGKYWLLKAANLGYTKAETAAGEFYYHGQNGFEKDYAESLKWYKRIAPKGTDLAHTNAQYNIGLFYLYGYGVEVDREEARRWFKESASNGNERAKKVLLYEYNEY